MSDSQLPTCTTCGKPVGDTLTDHTHDKCLEPKFPVCERYRARVATVGPPICVKCGHPPEAHAGFDGEREPCGWPAPHPDRNGDHCWCTNGLHGARESDLSPDVTRNAISPDELWAMQEKPHVSADAVDMGPIPGTEGIESDPPPCQHEPKCQMPNSPMSNEPYPPCHTEALARQSPLPDSCPAEMTGGVHEWDADGDCRNCNGSFRGYIARLEAERDVYRGLLVRVDDALDGDPGDVSCSPLHEEIAEALNA